MPGVAGPVGTAHYARRKTGVIENNHTKTLPLVRLHQGQGFAVFTLYWL
jgi:hypothetical protein